VIIRETDSNGCLQSKLGIIGYFTENYHWHIQIICHTDVNNSFRQKIWSEIAGITISDFFLFGPIAFFSPIMGIVD